MSRALREVRSTILEGNSFDPSSGIDLAPRDRELVARRTTALGPSYRLFYERPVHIVRGEGVFLYDADGEEYLDAYNNVSSIGHCNPAVVEAVTRQMRTLNTHTRYLGDGVVEYAERLLDTLPEAIDQAMFVCTGSEANDLALRIARQYTGGTGVVVSAEAYHGTTMLVAGASPATGGGAPLGVDVRTVPAPDAYRAETGSAADEPDAGDLGRWFAARVTEQFDDLRRHGIRPAALLVDSIFSSDGVFTDPVGFLRPAVEAAHAAGALVIVDEVQPGFARTGDTFWGFERHGVVPDLVTMGKPMGNGIPVAATAVRGEVLAPFGADVPYFNTFGGNPVAIAAARAVLDTIQDQRLQAASRDVGARLHAGLRDLARSHPLIGDVRGAGLYAGVELVTDPVAKTPATDAAREVVNGMRERRVLLSVCGPTNSTLKIRPLLVSRPEHIDRLLQALDDTLTDVENAS